MWLLIQRDENFSFLLFYKVRPYSKNKVYKNQEHKNSNTEIIKNIKNKINIKDNYIFKLKMQKSRI